MGGGERSFTLLTSALPVHPVAAWHLLNRGNEVCARVCAHTSPPPWPWPSLSHRARRRTEGVPPACASRCQRASLGRCPAHVSHLSRASLLNYFVLLFPRTFTTPVRYTPRRRVLEGEERGAREVDIKELLQGLASCNRPTKNACAALQACMRRKRRWRTSSSRCRSTTWSWHTRCRAWTRRTLLGRRATRRWGAAVPPAAKCLPAEEPMQQHSGRGRGGARLVPQAAGFPP